MWFFTGLETPSNTSLVTGLAIAAGVVLFLGIAASLLIITQRRKEILHEYGLTRPSNSRERVGSLISLAAIE